MSSVSHLVILSNITGWNLDRLFNVNNKNNAPLFHLIKFNNNAIKFLVSFVNTLLLPYQSMFSVLGFSLFIAIVLQLMSGFFLGWYYIPEPGLVEEVRNEMFEDTRYGYEIYNIHVRGVDVIFLLSYCHIVKKIYLKNYFVTDGDGWILGGYAFFWYHYIVFLGICLSATHLSDLTLTIAANIYWSLFNNTHKTYYWIFTNKHLNSDELMRLMMLHYITPWYYLYLVKLHIFFCHEGWDAKAAKNVFENKISNLVSWWYDAFHKETNDALIIVIMSYLYFLSHYIEIAALKYYFFERWNISELDEIRFYGVAPHWYFKPFMGLLTIAPTHFEGLMWFVLYFVLLTFLPIIYFLYNCNMVKEEMFVIMMKDSSFQSFLFVCFLFALYTTASMLPCGRYYYDLEGGYYGNTWVKWNYQYIYLYLGNFIISADIVEYILNKKAETQWLVYNYLKDLKLPKRLGLY